MKRIILLLVFISLFGCNKSNPEKKLYYYNFNYSNSAEKIESQIKLNEIKSATFYYENDFGYRFKLPYAISDTLININITELPNSNYRLKFFFKLLNENIDLEPKNDYNFVAEIYK